MTLADIRKLPVFKSQAVAAAEQADKGDTHNYLVDCLTAMFYGDYGNVPQEDTDINNKELVEGEGRIVARYDKRYALIEDIFIVALFSQEHEDKLEENRIMIMSEITNLDQKHIRNRLVITLPLLAVGAVLTQLDFNVLWRYFSWSNQTLAMIALWVATSYLLKTNKTRQLSLLTAVPATFMTAVCMTYILMSEEGLRLNALISYPMGIGLAAVTFAVYIYAAHKRN